MVNKNKRITVYASSGRISIKTIEKIARDHIDNGNKLYAQKALNEYRAANKSLYAEREAVARDIEDTINKMSDSNDKPGIDRKFERKKRIRNTFRG